MAQKTEATRGTEGFAAAGRGRDRGAEWIACGGIALAISLACRVAPVSAQCQYDLTEMERMSCGFFAVGGSPRGMDEQGVVVGQHNTCGGAIEEAFVWAPGEEVVFLPRPEPFNEALASDVNCHGQIAGWLASTTRTAALWDDGEAVDLGIPPGGNKSEASAINDTGEVVGNWGNSATADPDIHGFLWQDGKLIDLRPILGTKSGSAEGLNEHGDIVGWMGNGVSIDGRAYVLSDGVVRDLGVVPGGFTSRAFDINEHGDVVGTGLVEHDGGEVWKHSALWTGDEVIDLGFLPGLPGEPNTDARALNNARQVIGIANGRAFLWQHGEMHDLNDLLVAQHTAIVNTAWDVNEAGQIAARGGNTVLLTPVGRPPTDLDINCRTDAHDLLILLNEWNQLDSPADFDGDGIVGFADLLLLLDHWG